MKIDDSLPAAATARSLRELRRRQSRPGSTNNVEPAENVELTQAARMLQAMERALDDVPVMDMAKIESLRQAIAEGRYTVDEDAVAERLLKSILEQLRHRKP